MMLCLFVVVTMATVVNGQFLPIWSMDIKKDHALIGHVIKTVPLFKADCMTECRQTLACFSINIYKDQKGGHMCDLNRSTKKQSPGSLKPKPGYDYAEARESKFCSNENCLVTKDALPNMVYMFNSSLFQLINLSKTWQEARQHCQTLGADLASFNSELESRFVYEVLVSQSPKVKFGDKETYIARINMDGQDAKMSLLNGAKYESTDKGVALYMDGIDDFARFPRFPFYDKNFTLGVWLKIASLKLHAIVNDDDYRYVSFSFRIAPDGRLEMVMMFPNGKSIIKWFLKSNGTIPVNQWTHIGFTVDISTHVGTIYFNGTLDKSESKIISTRNMVNYNTNNYRIGRILYLKNGYFNGWMKDMTMIDRVLDQSEMKAFWDGEQRAWIGLNDKTTEGVFQWINGSPLTYQNVNSSVNSETRDCATVNLAESFPGNWTVRDCQELQYFICKN